ncbi:MAG: anaerobic ribonucleoside-triphosphate reductase activating protein [Patescibacteria group bacterium]|nr:anaerobic ribonucleoside-triphosphate reductase activating protein [Patescibacteria group bacterium]
MFLQGCNFRCPFCHNPELVFDNKNKSQITEDEILGYLVEKKKMLDGICITGGEPTLQTDLVDFIAKLKKIDYSVKLDTNGSNPEMLKELFDKKLLDYVAMDLKSSWQNYGEVVASNKLPVDSCKLLVEKCLKSFRLIQESGVDHEFRTTVYPQKHVEKDFMEMASYLKKGEKYYLQNIRYIKNLDPNLDQSKKIDVALLLSKLKQKYSDLIIEER